ncbi:hypothetical protein [Lacibacter sediminis]|uniref:Uncharacterized protein n=1 Tax=Lacibacter sediminis TaxID=2760713 RepID=A0A7G5XJT9_9BACT|nr:hypothetical protein [Lacibacter sediminis]QNA45742.1 hypothetical protein H4075_05970 [Lacibacter sediminis]
MLKGKWKALLILNYVNAAFWLIMLLVVILKLYQANQGGAEVKSNIVTVEAGGVIFLLFNILYIYVLKTYFPFRKLTGAIKVIYVLGLVFVGFVALLFLITLVFTSFGFYLGKGASNSNGTALILCLVVFSIVSLLIFIWQIQLMNVLKRNQENKLNSILNSIGVEESNPKE